MDNKLIGILKDGGIAVIPTDTIYGIVGSALNERTVKKIYLLRKRAPDKPFIILISSLNDLNQFNIKLSEKQKIFLEKNWPNPLSVILLVKGEKWKYLHRGTDSLGFRMPKDDGLHDLLKRVGPLVAPSANPEREKPAKNVEEARKYFGDEVDFYVDGGVIKSKPSTLIQIKIDGSWQILRQGSYKISS